MDGTPYSIESAGFWRAYWITLRPYLCFLSGVTGLLGLVAVPGNATLLGLVPPFLAFFASYGLGQALTDVFQVDTDSISSPYRPLTHGVITPRQVFVVSVFGLTLCGLVLASLSWWTLPLSALGIFGLVTYTPFKRRWWAGPFYNAWIVALLPLIGMVGVGGNLGASLRVPSIWGLEVSVFFSYAIFVLLGYHKDISADRQTGYETLPVRFGWGTSVVVSTGLLAACLAGSLLLMFNSLAAPMVSGNLDSIESAVAWGFWAVGAAAFVWAHRLMARCLSEKQAHHSIGWVVRGYVLLHLGEAIAMRPSLALVGLPLCAGFEWVLATRPETSQI